MAEEKHNQEDKLNSSLNKLVNLAKTEAIVKFARNNLDYAFNQIDAAKKAYDTRKDINNKTQIKGNNSGSIKSIPLIAAEKDLIKITKLQEGVINEAELALKSAELEQNSANNITENFRSINLFYNEMKDANNDEKLNDIIEHLQLAVRNINTIYTSVSDKLTIAKKNNNKNCVGLALNNGQTQAKRVVIAEIATLITKDKNGNISSVITAVTETDKNKIRKVTNAKSQKLIEIYKCLDGSFHKVRPDTANHRYQNTDITFKSNPVRPSTNAEVKAAAISTSIFAKAANAKAANTKAAAINVLTSNNSSVVNGQLNTTAIKPYLSHLNELKAIEHPSTPIESEEQSSLSGQNLSNRLSKLTRPDAPSSNVSNLLPNMANLNRIAAANAAKAANAAAPASAFAAANKRGLAVIPNSSQPRESNITQANLNGGRRKTHRNKKSKSQRKRKHTRKH